MRVEWSQGGGVDEVGGRDPIRVATSWSTRRLRNAAIAMTVALFALGVASASLVTAPIRTAVSGAAVAAEPVPITDDPAPVIGDALTVERNGPLVPAPVEHLTVVSVSVSVCGERHAGSGVVVADDLVLTAAHVVGDATLVRIDHRGTTVTGEVLGVLGDGRDVALVRVDAPMAEPLAAGAPPVDGDPITLVGHLDGGPRAVLVGPAVPVATEVAALVAGDVLGVDVSIRPGISGGPAVDTAGEMVGLVVAFESTTDTALVVRLPDLATIGSAPLLPGTCPETA